MGQRFTDPAGPTLDHFTMCSEGWPQIIRINPILNWHYDTVWKFLRGLQLEYCKLYDEGYTSLGNVKNTKRNPLIGLKPAYTLPNGNIYERINRQL